MINKEFFRDVIRYGIIKSDFECRDSAGRLYRVRVIEYTEKKYFVVQCNGEPLELKEV